MESVAWSPLIRMLLREIRYACRITRQSSVLHGLQVASLPSPALVQCAEMRFKASNATENCFANVIGAHRNDLSQPPQWLYDNMSTMVSTKGTKPIKSIYDVTARVGHICSSCGRCVMTNLHHA